MSQRAQVKCIRKRGSHYNPHERIQGIGGFGTSQWYLAEDDAIGKIERREWAFYVNAGGREVSVEVATHEQRKYLKTTADGYAPNNLLALPECP